jgi:hypothetical protein
MPATRQDQRGQLRLKFDQAGEFAPRANIPTPANDDAGPFSLALPNAEIVTRAEVDRIPVLLERLDSGRAKHPRVHGVNDNRADDEPGSEHGYSDNCG